MKLKSIFSINNIAVLGFGLPTLILSLSLSFSDESLMVLGVLLLVLNGSILLLRQFVYISTLFRFSNVIAASTLLATSLGTLIAYTTDTWEVTLSRLGVVDDPIIALTESLIYVNLCCFVFFALDIFLKPSNRFSLITIDSLILQKIRYRLDQIIFPLLGLAFIISIIQAYLIVSGRYGFIGAGRTDRAESGLKFVNPEVELALLLVPLGFLILGIITLKFRQLSKSDVKFIAVFMYGFTILVEFSWLFSVSSRSAFGFSSLLFLFGMRISTFSLKSFTNDDRADSINQDNQFSTRKIIIVFTSILLFIYLGVSITSFSRFLANKAPSFKEDSFQERLSFVSEQLYSYYITGDSIFEKDEFESKLDQNLKTRGFVITGLIAIYNDEDYYPLLGEDIFYSSMKAIPGVIFPGKYVFPSQEGLYNQRYSLTGVRDIADSFYLSSFVDFYWFGSILYPLIMFTILNIYLKLINRQSRSIFGLILLVSILFSYSLSGGEGTMIGFFVMLRNGIILFILFELIPYIRKLKK